MTQMRRGKNDEELIFFKYQACATNRKAASLWGFLVVTPGAWLVAAHIGTWFASQVGSFSRQGGSTVENWQPSGLVTERGRAERVYTFAFHQFTWDVFIHLRNWWRDPQWVCFHSVYNNDVCLFILSWKRGVFAGRAKSHQPLFPHYTKRVFSIWVGGSLKRTNSGNPHLDKHLRLLLLSWSKDFKGLPSKTWDS